MGQGSSMEPKSISTRVAFRTIFCLAIFVLTCYSAKMISFLTFVKIHPPVESLQEILQSDYNTGTMKGSGEGDMFVNARE